MAKKWSEIADSEDFRALSDDDKDVVRESYFDRVVAPEVDSAELESTRERFNQASGYRSRKLPEGVRPSEAGGGRGAVNPPPAEAPTPAPPALAGRRGTMRAVEPFVGGDVRQGAGGAGRGVVNPPMVGEARRAGESVLDFAARPEQQALQAATATDVQRTAGGLNASVSPTEVARRERAAGVGRPTGIAEPLEPEEVAGMRLARSGAGPIVQGVASGLAELGKVVPGAVVAAADAVGADRVSEFAQGAARRAGRFQESSMPQGEGLDKNVASVFSSITTSLPFMVTGTAAEQQAMKLMFGQTALADYADRRAKGIAPLPAAITASVSGGAEVLGEKFGFREQTIAVRTLMDRMAAAGRSPDDIAKNAAKLLLKEVPGEQLTTAIQFLNEKYNVGGMTPEATLQDYFKQVIETAVTTMGQSAVVGGTPAALDKASRAYRDADRAIEEVAQRLPKGPYQDAAKEGLVVDPPLVTDPPARQRAKVLAIFDNLAAKHGIPAEAVKRAKAATDGMPAADVGPFLADLASVLQKRGRMAQPLPESATALLTAGPVALPEVPKEGAKKPAAAPPPPAPAPTPAGPPATPAEEDLSGLSEPTPSSTLEDAAHAAATSPKNDLPEPTPAQAEAGNYAKGHVKVGGLDLSIENPEGSVRKDMKNDPPKWQTTMRAHYGYIRGTKGADGDHVDTYIKPGTPDAFDGQVFIVDQQAGVGKFDEHKVMLGYANGDEARDAYLAHYPAGWRGMGAMTTMSMADFKAWTKGDTTQPASPAFFQRAADEPAQPDVQRAPSVVEAPAPGRSDQPAGGGGNLGPVADASARVDVPAAPGRSVRADVPVERAGGDAGAVAPRVIARAGVTPKTAEPIELRQVNGKTIAYHGKHEILDFETGNPVEIPADATDAQALELVKAAKAFGRNTKVFVDKASTEEQKPEAAPAPAPAPDTTAAAQPIGTEVTPGPGQLEASPPAAAAAPPPAKSVDTPAESPVDETPNLQDRAAIEAEIDRLGKRSRALHKKQLKAPDGEQRDALLRQMDAADSRIRELLAQLPDETAEQEEAAPEPEADAFEPAPTWRQSMYYARTFARHLGIDVTGLTLEDLVPAIQKALKQDLQTVNADERVDIDTDAWEVTDAGPTLLEIEAAGASVRPGAFVQTHYGWLAPLKVVKVVTGMEEFDDAPSTQIQMQNLHRPRKGTNSLVDVFLRDGKLYEARPSRNLGPNMDREGYPRVYVLDKALPSEDPSSTAPKPKKEKPAPPPAPTVLTDKEAFAGNYAAFEGKTLEQPVQVAETGETATLRMDAAKALRELDKREKALKALKDCLEKPR
jgi:hypothetical protein